MSPYIESAKRQARNIVSIVKQENPHSTFLFGAVFYRDFGDTPQFHVVPFKEDITDDIQHIQAEGGGDIPEDVAGGYQKVLDMDWSDATVKFCFHIADAPPHGLAWHDPDIEDNFLLLPDSRSLEDIIGELHEQTIRLSFIRIHSSTDRMIENFRTVYGNELNIMELDVDDNTIYNEDPIEILDSEFSGMITRHISSTLSMFD
jgi:hypothetical protein